MNTEIKLNNEALGFWVLFLLAVIIALLWIIVDITGQEELCIDGTVYECQDVCTETPRKCIDRF